MENKGEVRLRNVDIAALTKLEAMASKQGTSRNTLIKKLIETFAFTSEIDAIEEKYATLVQTVLTYVQQNTIELNRLSLLIERGNQHE